MGGSPRVPSPPRIPERSDEQVRAAAAEERRRAAAAKGRQSTILTGESFGQPLPPVQRKTLLGQ